MKKVTKKYTGYLSQLRGALSLKFLRCRSDLIRTLYRDSELHGDYMEIEYCTSPEKKDFMKNANYYHGTLADFVESSDFEDLLMSRDKYVVMNVTFHENFYRPFEIPRKFVPQS